MFPGETILSGAKSHEQDPHISEFKVLRSAAGYYIGTIWTACGECAECKKDEWMTKGWSEPNSRETEYFDTEEEATKALGEYRDSGFMPEAR